MKASEKTKENQDEKRPKPVFQESSSLYPNLIDLETELSPPPYADPNPPLLPQLKEKRKRKSYYFDAADCAFVRQSDRHSLVKVFNQKPFLIQQTTDITSDIFSDLNPEKKTDMEIF
ncbi:hypothetical protein MG293_009957 [Ovis ammon polii]|uniref:Uncharacterized protein n=1 Tax=Ovis ammon polii TaxID=230172 RepID=A0AAD4Y9X7_OVIAM|nr:hypothetical protein MG293_009957 [Ovis ammon polii]